MYPVHTWDEWGVCVGKDLVIRYWSRCRDNDMIYCDVLWYCRSVSDTHWTAVKTTDPHEQNPVSRLWPEEEFLSGFFFFFSVSQRSSSDNSLINSYGVRACVCGGRRKRHVNHTVRSRPALPSRLNYCPLAVWFSRWNKLSSSIGLCLCLFT